MLIANFLQRQGVSISRHWPILGHRIRQIHCGTTPLLARLCKDRHCVSFEAGTVPPLERLLDGRELRNILVDGALQQQEKADLTHSHTFMAGSLATADTGILLTPSKELEAILKNQWPASQIVHGHYLARCRCRGARTVSIRWLGIEAPAWQSGPSSQSSLAKCKFCATSNAPD